MHRYLNRFRSSYIQSDLRIEFLFLVRQEPDIKHLQLISHYPALRRSNRDLFTIELHMKHRGYSNCVLDVKLLLLGLDPDRDAVKLDALLLELALGLVDYPGALDVHGQAVLDLQSHDLLLGLRPGRREKDLRNPGGARGDLVEGRGRDEDPRTARDPLELGCGIASVGDHDLLGAGHLERVVGELELKDFLGDIKGHWLGLGLDSELEGDRVIDEVCDVLLEGQGLRGI